MASKLVEVKVVSPGQEKDGVRGLAVVLAGGRKIEVAAGFAKAELVRLVSLLEKM